MGMFWSHGDMFVREVVERFDEPRPRPRAFCAMRGSAILSATVRLCRLRNTVVRRFLGLSTAFSAARA